ncbi:hypothetical protein ACFQ1S_25265 [Kibdelosporangium lantanae]|uniref:Uncharacterized protein n=1 Tax=Kibdelosporangium lantanae TaxID=1497396 RepID=A0ABW3MG35_9PSEU
MSVQGYNPRTGKPYGEPVEATSDTEVDRLTSLYDVLLDWSEVIGSTARSSTTRDLPAALCPVTTRRTFGCSIRPLL